MASLLAAAVACGQVVPASPTKFTTRSVGGALSSGSVQIGPAGPTGQETVRYTMRVTLSEPRPWISSDGKTIVGRLIAFEDVTIESPKGAPVPEFTPPQNPTVVKDGKARLLVKNKTYVLPLERLSQDDRDFIESVRAATASEPPAGE